MQTASNKELMKRKTFGSVLWNFARFAGTYLLGFAVFIVLARLLVPEDFGVFALAFVFIGLANAVVFLSLHEAVLQTQALDEETADTAFWAALGLGLAAGGAVFALAPLYGRLVDTSETIAPVQTLAVTLPLSGLGTIHSARKLREFGHRAIAIRELLAVLLGGLCGIFAARSGLGVWSLVAQQLIYAAVIAVGAWVTFPWLPRPRFRLVLLQKLVRFGGPLTLANALHALSDQVDGAIIARTLGVTDLGALRVARRVADAVGQTPVQPLSMTAAVTLAQLQDDREAFRAALLRMLGVAAALVMPLLYGMGVVAPDLVVLFFGAKWASAGTVVQILGTLGLPLTVNAFAWTALAARGHSHAIVRSSTTVFLFSAVALLIAAPFGLLALTAAMSLRAHFATAYYLRILNRELGVAPSEVLARIMPAFIAAAFMTGALVLIAPNLRVTTGGTPSGFILLAIPMGALLYAFGLFLLARKFLFENIAAIWPLIGRQRLQYARK